MKLRSEYAFLLVLCFIFYTAVSKNNDGPAAKFSFNNKRDYDEISNRKAKLVGVAHTEDRFGNANSALYLFGNENSYVNLGAYTSLKPRSGTISLWIKMEAVVYSGMGSRVNPIIITKCADRDDFYEAYVIYYIYDNKRIVAGASRDSLKQCAVYAMREFELLTWHHLAFTYSDEYLCFYIDGKPEGKMLKNFRTKFNPLDSVMVGTCANKKNNRFTNGIVDDIEIYDRVLNADEINQLYHAPNPDKNKIILNWMLFVCAILGAIIIIYMMVKYRLTLTLKKEKEKLELANTLLENELRINRALMNPHFIFNSLNTLHNYILKNNQDKASDYLVRFSRLIRKILDSNMSDIISLEMEIELIRGYLEIEGMRFKEHIKYDIILEPGVIPVAINIPIMMIQPFIENAVWHGLLDKPGDKLISVKFSLYETSYLKCVIEDNGTGFKKKTSGSLEKKSLATGFAQQRLALLNRIHHLNSWLDVTYKPGGQGTIVTLILPILNT